MREDGGLSVDAGEGIFIIMYQNNFTREDYYNHPSQTKTNIEKLNQFLESCNKTNADLRKRSIEEDNDTREDVCAMSIIGYLEVFRVVHRPSIFPVWYNGD